MKQKALSDLNFMTAIESNTKIIMGNRSYGTWILDILFSVFPPKSEEDMDPIWEMG